MTRFRSQNPIVLREHVQHVAHGTVRFQNAYESVYEMILNGGHETKIVNGQPKTDFKIFRQGNRPMVGMYNEIMSLVSYIKNGAENGPAREMAFVIIGEAGNGKTTLIEYLCDKYREHVSMPANQRFTFRFTGLDNEKFDNAFGLANMESQTFEDPMILAMNLFSEKEKNIAFLQSCGMNEEQIDCAMKKYRPLGACTEYNFTRMIEQTALSDNDILRLVDEHVRVVPVKIGANSGILTGKFSPLDKQNSTSADLIGNIDVQRTLLLDPENPYTFNLRIGALARSACGGIHLADEYFRNKPDLLQIYLSAIQNRTIEWRGYKWPMDTIIIATSNHVPYANFAGDGENAPLLDRCQPCYVGHCTNKNEQIILTRYALGDVKTTITGQKMHIDPNLESIASIATVFTRFPENKGDKKLSREDMLHLCADESAGDKTKAMLKEIVESLDKEQDFRKRFGQTGLGQRGLQKALVSMQKLQEVEEGKCLFTDDVFEAFKNTVRDDPVLDLQQKTRFIDEEFPAARNHYLHMIRETMFNAYLNDPDAIRGSVRNYVNMVVAIGSQQELRSDQRTHVFTDPISGRRERIDIDQTFINGVEDKLGLTNKERKENFRSHILKLVGQHTWNGDRNYDFMDNKPLVHAVTDYTLDADINGCGSLAGALVNRMHDENNKLYNRLLETMTTKLGHCTTCAERTMKVYCDKNKKG